MGVVLNAGCVFFSIDNKYDSFPVPVIILSWYLTELCMKDVSDSPFYLQLFCESMIQIRTGPCTVPLRGSALIDQTSTQQSFVPLTSYPIPALLPRTLL